MNEKVKSKDVLIETASRLFKVRGYCGVGLNDIIEESGIPKGSLYYYFPEGKEQLAIAAIDNTKKLVMEDIKHIFNKTSNLIDALQAYVYELSKVFGEGGDPIGSPIGTIAGEKHSTSEPIRLACEATFKSWQSIYTEKFLEAGYPEDQAKSLATVFHALTEGGILLALTMKSGKPLEAIAEQIPSLFIKKLVEK
ncbi:MULTISPECIES: TetR/AcrR family transcriptional regulator [Psychrobacter]|jgi:TetR/AcrR family transcriptional repressor of lmrAB and yxaGH operons|uniref:TetR/AcrR family transcriptional regulator n=1 Tax=Psychrobacter TaxID=497 RepID=UPI00040533F9|nr:MULTISPECIES: TetR/AcrR family transcriptional regulator [Psychrobacter]PKG36514.1 TetR/AcrR family transcriptional regulator [Psychrobacter sp. Sarcosine-3u-12]